MSEYTYMIMFKRYLIGLGILLGCLGIGGFCGYHKAKEVITAIPISLVKTVIKKKVVKTIKREVVDIDSLKRDSKPIDTPEVQTVTETTTIETTPVSVVPEGVKWVVGVSVGIDLVTKLPQEEITLGHSIGEVFGKTMYGVGKVGVGAGKINRVSVGIQIGF